MINPAFYENLVALNSDTHRNLRLDETDFSFARHCTSVPVLYSELIQASQEYPIVFMRAEDSQFRPVVLLGTSENLFVNSDCQWDAKYLPLSVQHYPFDLSGESLLLDEKCAALNHEQGELLIDAEGILQQRVEDEKLALLHFQEEAARTELMTSQLDQLDLFVSCKGRLDIRDQLGNLYLIDEEKFSQIDDAALPPLFHSGAIKLAYLQISSLENIPILMQLKAYRSTENKLKKPQGQVESFPRKRDPDMQRPKLKLAATPQADDEIAAQRKQDVARKLAEEMNRLAQIHKERYAQNATETTPVAPAPNKKQPRLAWALLIPVLAGIAIFWSKSEKTPAPPPAHAVATDAVATHAVNTDPFSGTMISIKPGSFEMGSTDGDADEKPVRTVAIGRAFELAKTEVTQAEWKSVMGSLPEKLSFKNCGDNCPVENVSWNDIHEFIDKLNAKSGKKYRLPSEAEWEYACRAGGTHRYCGSDNLDAVAWYGNKTPHPVATREANAWGLYDMSGNVWEWIEDCYSSHYGDMQGSCDARVLRGGSWSNEADTPRSANRYKRLAKERFNNGGFRLARELAQ